MSSMNLLEPFDSFFFTFVLESPSQIFTHTHTHDLYAHFIIIFLIVFCFFPFSIFFIVLQFESSYLGDIPNVSEGSFSVGLYEFM